MVSSERYARAAQLTGPRLAGRLPSIRDGYWLGNDKYFFDAEEFDPDTGTVVPVPKIADLGTRTVRPILSADVLGTILSDHCGVRLDPLLLSAASIHLLDENCLAVGLKESWYLLDLRTRSVREIKTLGNTPGLYSPNSQWAVFLRANNLWLMNLANGHERALTEDGDPQNAYGQISETALSAVEYRKRPFPQGLWSNDSKWFLTHQIDERNVPSLSLIENVPSAGGRPVLHTFPYPMPGDPLPVATFVAIDVLTGRRVKFDNFPTEMSVLSPFAFQQLWFGPANIIYAIRLDRHCRTIELIRLDPERGVGRIMVKETVDDAYLDLHPLLSGTPNVRVLEETDEVIWYSERDGWGHLFLYDARSGGLKRQITVGDYQVRDIVHVDLVGRQVYFLASHAGRDVDPAWRRLCSANLDRPGVDELVARCGDISISIPKLCDFPQNAPCRPASRRPGFSPDGRHCAAFLSSPEDAGATSILDLQSLDHWTIEASQPGRDRCAVERFTAMAADGATKLFGTMFFPSDFDESRCYPLIDYIYPGPQAPQGPQSLNSVRAAFAQAIAEIGFVTIMIDTRGTPLGSRAFRQASYRNLLDPQLQDHATIVRQLVQSRPYLSRDGAGIIGQSAGGAAAARALCEYGDVFTVGVAACGNYDNRYYTSFWSDKYRGKEDISWTLQDVCPVAHQLSGQLLLISGDMDANVHVSQTLRFADSLIRANKDFDLIIVPNVGHEVLMNSGYVQRRAWDFFVRHLLGQQPPTGFDLSYSEYELARISQLSLEEVRR